MDGFTLHAATRAGAADAQGREARLRYVLRPAIAQERVEQRPDGLVRITLKRAFGDGTVAVDMDPPSLVARLAAAVPPPRFHTVKYAGVLASAHKWRRRIAPERSDGAAGETAEEKGSLLGAEPVERALAAGCLEGLGLVAIAERTLEATVGWKVTDDQTVLVHRRA